MADALRAGVVAALTGVKAYDLPAACDRVGLPGSPPSGADAEGEQSEAFASKRLFVMRRMEALSSSALLEVAKRTHALRPTFALGEALARACEAGEPAITEFTRRNVVDELAAGFEPDALGGKLDVVEFLRRVWPLDEMPSTDRRFQTAAGDVHQHTVNNADWSTGYLLLQYLELPRASDALVGRFLEALVHPLVREGDEQRAMVSRLDAHLAPDGLHLVPDDVLSGHPVYRLRPRAAGVGSAVKNLIFAARLGRPKPDLVLADAVSNDVRIVEGAEDCLVYDRPVPAEGLTWRALVDWWAAREDLPPDAIDTERVLYRRLEESLDPALEAPFFRRYFAALRQRLGARLPALVPQVYLHYDPRTVRQRARAADAGGGPVPLPRQRMDFLLLFSPHARVVVEIDGQHHYTDDRGRPSPARYAEMAAADRDLRLGGYEVYRFGGYELQPGRADDVTDAFFAQLLRAHRVL